jgi:hypothetical protein
MFGTRQQPIWRAMWFQLLEGSTGQNAMTEYASFLFRVQELAEVGASGLKQHQY